MLVHSLNHQVQILLSPNLHDVIRVVLHAFLLLIDRLKKVCNLLNRCLIFLLDRLDHPLLQQLGHLVSQTLKSLLVLLQKLLHPLTFPSSDP